MTNLFISENAAISELFRLLPSILPSGKQFRSKEALRDFMESCVPEVPSVNGMVYYKLLQKERIKSHLHQFIK